MTRRHQSQRPLALRAFIRHQRRRLRLGKLARYLEVSEQIPGWKRHGEAEALARTTQSMGNDAVIVEIGVFLGSASVFLAGARKIAGTGVVHCIDPFDGSGDDFSAPIYREILKDINCSPLEAFTQTIDSLDLADFVRTHQGTAESVGEVWDTPIDLLFLDGDQSPDGARSAFEVWEPWLRSGGTLVIGNSSPREYELDHDGNFLLATERIIAPAYTDIRLIGSTTFARKR